SSTGAVEPNVSAARVDEHRNLGIAFYKTGMLDEALREFRRVADLRASEASAPFYVGLIALKQAKWSEAVESLRMALDRGGPRPAALYNLAFGLERMGKLDEAETTYGEAVTRARDDARMMTGWAIAALKRGDASVASGRLQRARELWGDKAPPAIWYWAAALSHAVESDLEQAITVAQDGVTAYPNHAVLKNNLAVLLELTGDVSGAEVMVREALTEDPSVPQLSKNLGDLLYRAGKYDEADEAYQRAVKLAPDLGDDLYFKLGNIAFRQRDTAKARTQWQRTIELNPDHQLARSNLESMSSESAG
ncbi:MAG: tetratricopeptide repeat protein, partial [Gemmatimonadales bacterium]